MLSTNNVSTEVDCNRCTCWWKDHFSLLFCVSPGTVMPKKRRFVSKYYTHRLSPEILQNWSSMYVRKTTAPTFDDFILENTENTISWCLQWLTKIQYKFISPGETVVHYPYVHKAEFTILKGYFIWCTLDVYKPQLMYNFYQRKKLNRLSTFNKSQWEQFHVGGKALVSFKSERYVNVPRHNLINY